MSAQPQDLRDEDGIGMIEIVVSMLILAMIALAFLPVLTQGLLSTRNNSNVSTATQLLSAQMDAANAARGTCSSVNTFVTTSVPAATVGGISYQISRAALSSSGTPLANPGNATQRCTDWTAAGTARVRITVSTIVGGVSKTLAKSDTRILVGAP